MNKRIVDKVRRYLNCHWFINKFELRKAREILTRYFPDEFDFNLKFFIVDLKTEDDITASDLREFIINAIEKP